MSWKRSRGSASARALGGGGARETACPGRSARTAPLSGRRVARPSLPSFNSSPGSRRTVPARFCPRSWPARNRVTLPRRSVTTAVGSGAAEAARPMVRRNVAVRLPFIVRPPCLAPVADQDERRPEVRVSGAVLAEELDLRLANGFGPALFRLQLFVEALHQRGGRRVRDLPETGEDRRAPRLHEAVRQSLHLGAGIRVAQRGLAGAQHGQPGRIAPLQPVEIVE